MPTDSEQTPSSMAARLLAEDLIGLAAAARRLPPARGGRPVHPSTLARWVAAGVRASDGRLVRLEAVRVGSRWVTSAQALERFAETLTPGAAPQSSVPRSPTARRRAAAAAAAELERRGA